MTRELIIEGQHVDLAPDTDITLEFVNNIIGDIGKISLSRSYTVKIPKTIRNARILDDPGRPGHESGVTRRFLNARYYRNGIDLIGDVRAYLLHTTEDAYELALVWNSMESLERLSQTSEKLNDLPDLPTIRWIGESGLSPDYTGGDDVDGALHAWYNSGLGLNRTPYMINAATHPSMEIWSLFDRIMRHAGVAYTLHSEAAQKAMQSQALLAAPSRKPSAQMDAESGTSYDYAFTETDTGDKALRTSNDYRTDGWDPVVDQYYNIKIGSETKHRVLINIKVPTDNLADFSGVDLIIQGHNKDGYDPNGAELARIQLKDGAYYFDEELEVSGFGTYYEIFSTNDIPSVEFTAYKSGLPLLRYYKPHEEIQIEKDNRFPIEGNLPDIGQWAFIKACFAYYGLVPVIRNETLHLYGYDDILDLSNAYDWSVKVDMTTDGEPRDFSYAVDGWAQRNNIAFEENQDLPFDPTVVISIDDQTLKDTRDWFELPFAASHDQTAVHYKQTKDGTYESEDISPRIFSIGLGLQGKTLTFAEDMHGTGMKAKYYARVQSVLQRPIVITLNIRLHEIDLAQLDLSRPVYLKQYGKYYAILKIQTSDTDLCKVQLLQLP